MRRSYLKLIVSSVLLFWLIDFGVLFAYAKSRDWSEQHVRAHGLLWAYRTLDEAPATERDELVAEIADCYAVEIATVTLDEAERAIGAPVRGGRRYFDRRERYAQRLYIPFHDGSGAFVAGPIDPLGSTVHYRIGVILAFLLPPLVASMVGIRLATQLRKVESATEALGSGLLSARVDNLDGPSHELAASFNAMAERVERLVKDREELVQAVSHELGSPLSRLRFQLDLVENSHDPAARRERFVAIARELDELDELVAELLSWVQSDDIALKRQDFNVVKPLSDLALLAELHALEDREVSVRAELPATAAVHADPRLFQRAIENILRNAVRYGKGAVAISLAEMDGYLHVIVDDDGPGIPVGERKRVLQPFARLEADRDRATGGVGLGLAIVSRIVQRHGGTITVDDAPLGGARITTTWPSTSEERAKLAPKGPNLRR